MTREQETIERLNRFKTIKVLYGNTFAMTTEQLKTLQEDIKTALNIIKEKDKKLEKKDEYIETQEENYKNLISGVSFIAQELELEEDGTIDEIYAEIKKKDKQINYMANFINDNTPYNKDLKELENEEGRRTANFTAKYFERKIEKWKKI